MKAMDAVTFDLWQTLLLEDRELGLKRAQLRIDGAYEALRDAGWEFSTEHLWEAYRSCALACNATRAQGDDISFAEQIDIFIERIGPGLYGELSRETVQRIGVAYDRAFWGYPPSLHPQAAATLGRLKEMGYSLGLISNTGMTPGATFREYMEQLGILGYFDALVFSDEVRLAKPSQKIFRLTLEALEASTGRAVHVGDDRTNDVAGAKLAGLKAIWISSAGGPEVDTVGAQSGSTADVTVSDLGEVVNAVKSLVSGQT